LYATFTDNDSGEDIYDLVNLAYKTSYLALGLYVATQDVDEQEFNAKKKALDTPNPSIKEGDLAGQVENIRRVTQLQFPSFWTPGQEALQPPGIVPKTDKDDTALQLAAQAKKLGMVVLGVTRENTQKSGEYAPVNRQAVSSIAEILHDISDIYSSAPTNVQLVFQQHKNWNVVSHNNRWIESFKGYDELTRKEWRVVSTKTNRGDKFVEQHVHEFVSDTGQNIINWDADDGLLARFLTIITLVMDVIRNLKNTQPSNMVVKARAAYIQDENYAPNIVRALLVAYTKEAESITRI
jgi:hypothetical protein